MKRSVLMVAMMIVFLMGFGSASAYEDRRAADAAAELNNENQNVLSQGINYNPRSEYNNNTNVGSLPSAYGTGTQLMDYRPGYLKDQAVEAPLGNLVKFGPRVITRQMLATAKSRIVDKKGKPVYKKEVWKDLIVRDAVYYASFPEGFALKGKINPSNSVRQIFLQEFPEDAVEGVDYLWLGPIIATSRSKKELIFTHNLRDAVLERAMDRGANAVILEGQGADRDIKSGSTAANFWSSLAQIFGTSNPWGFNFSPGVTFQGGTTSEITMPFVGAVGVVIVNWDKFLHPVKIAKTEPDQFDGLRRDVRETEEGIAKCKTYCKNNLALRNRQGKNFLKAAQLNKAAGKREEAVKAMQIADHHFEMAEKNYAAVRNQKKDDAQTRELFHDSIYWRAGVINALRGQAAATQYAQRHGLERFPKFN